MDAPKERPPAVFSKSRNTFCLWLDHGCISCTAWLPALRVHRSNGLPSVWDSRGRHTVSWICTARWSPPSGQNKSPVGLLPRGSFTFYFRYYTLYHFCPWTNRDFYGHLFSCRPFLFSSVHLATIHRLDAITEVSGTHIHTNHSDKFGWKIVVAGLTSFIGFCYHQSCPSVK